jgi:hypothetical protein
MLKIALAKAKYSRFCHKNNFYSSSFCLKQVKQRLFRYEILYLAEGRLI